MANNGHRPRLETRAATAFQGRSGRSGRRWLQRLPARLCTLSLSLAIVAGAGAQQAQAPGGQTDSTGEPARAATPDIAPPDVYVRTQLARDELELIRRHLGRPKSTASEIQIAAAAPREVYFQALTLWRKANRLRFELTREQAPESVPPGDEIRPGHVQRVVDDALDRLRGVKTKLGISERSVERQRDASRTPSDVFRSVVEANRQLNLLLDRRFAPSDAYQQLTQALGYSSGLRAHFPGKRMPATPTLERGKSPADVYARLIRCFQQARRIAEHSGLRMLDLEPDASADATPSDVYDLASLLVSELTYLHSKLGRAEPPPTAQWPGHKLSSHVYQRAGLLEAQLAELETFVDADPSWLANAQGPR